MRLHRQWKSALVLAAALLLAQVAASSHLLEHVSDFHGDRCVACAVAQQFDHFADAHVSQVIGLRTAPAVLAGITPGGLPRPARVHGHPRAPPAPFPRHF